jgi:hypothetical protein
MGAQIATAIVAVAGKGSCTWWTRYCTNNHENAQRLPATGPMGYRRAPWRAACTARASLGTLDYSCGKPCVPDYHAAMIDTLPWQPTRFLPGERASPGLFAFHSVQSRLAAASGGWEL